ncbi:hypothetical protein M3Y94_01221000 [Aphelenchoides besseyi]|nr:hypothetical protein M3Y94_01221000 [Aphelenchoides besseyi]KAI6219721.1 hypothetical protein M3Y95_01096800 [Aphelenchoides besseyi]
MPEYFVFVALPLIALAIELITLLVALCLLRADYYKDANAEQIKKAKLMAQRPICSKCNGHEMIKKEVEKQPIATVEVVDEMSEPMDWIEGDKNENKRRLTPLIHDPNFPYDIISAAWLPPIYEPPIKRARVNQYEIITQSGFY